MKPADEVLYDSEASLRLVDSAIEELSAAGTELDHESREFLEHVMSQPGGFSELSKSLLRAYAETLGIVARMQGSRAVFDPAEFDRLNQMYGKLREVSCATELAATDILDGLGRAIAVVERLDDEGSEAGRRHLLVGALREELYDVVAHLQFQDITAQQITHVSTLLAETRQRLLEMLRAFTPATALIVEANDDLVLDARVATLDTGERQAVIDQTLAGRGARMTA